MAAVLVGCTGTAWQDQHSPGDAVQVSPSPSASEDGPNLRMAVVDQGLRQGCHEAADTLGFAVPCPTRVPGTSGDVECETPGAFSAADVTLKFGCVLGEGFILQPRIRSSDVDATIGHFVIEAGPAVRPCTHESPTDVTVHGAVVYMGKCDQDGGLHFDHVAAVWELQAITYVVSAHGWTAYDQHAVLETVRHVELVEPRSPS